MFKKLFTLAMTFRSPALTPRKRPSNLGLLLIGTLLGLPTGLLLASFFPERSPVKALAGILGIAVPPAILLAYSSKKWTEYTLYMRSEYEAAKDRLRRRPTNPQTREAMVAAGRAYYASMREGGVTTANDEQAIANDLKAIIG